MPWARVVDPDVDAAEPPQCFVDDAHDVHAPHHVSGDDKRTIAAASGDGPKRIGSPGNEHHGGAAGGEQFRGSRADAAARAGDDDHLVHDVRVVHPLRLERNRDQDRRSRQVYRTKS